MNDEGKKKRRKGHGRVAVYVRKSVLTGEPVFVAFGKRRCTANDYYFRARNAEEQRIREMEATQKKACRDVIQKLLNDCVADLPLMKEWTPAQRNAAKNLRYLATHPVLPDHGFLEHIRAERKINAEKRPWQHKKK